MKSLFLFLLCFVLAFPVMAISKTEPTSSYAFAPQWSDVCAYTAFWDIDVNKNYLKKDKKYWKERRIQFNKEIAACENMSSKEVSGCYAHVVNLEAERTAKWETTYKDERKARLTKTGIAAAWTAILGAFVCIADWW